MKKIILASLLAAAISPAIAQAADGTISFTGNVTAVTCTLTSGTSGTQTVVMPDVSTATLKEPGDTAGLRVFNVTLGNCGNTVRSVRLDFGNAPAASVDPATGNMINTARTGSNVQIALYDGSNATTPMRLGATSAFTTAVNSTTAGTASIPLAARYVATGQASAGAVASSIAFTIAYP